MKIHLIYILAFCLVQPVTLPGQDPERSFHDLMGQYLNSLKTNPHEMVFEYNGRWRKKRYILKKTYPVKYEKYNPPFNYKAILVFQLQDELTEFWNDRESAMSAKKYYKTDATITTHQHEYFYYNNRWVVAKRANIDSTFSDLLEWENCNLIGDSGQTKGKPIFEECWEPNTEMKFGLLQTEEDFDDILYPQFKDEKYDTIIQLTSTYIKKYPHLINKLPELYYRRAHAKISLNQFHSAILDCDTAIQKAPNVAEFVRLRGYAKKLDGDYNGAIVDYKRSLEIHPDLAMANLNIAALLEEVNRGHESCTYYERALDLGLEEVYEVMMAKCDTASLALQRYTYRILVDKSNDKTYGYSLNNPVLTGGAHNAYLNLLRDAKGNKVQYVRLGSSMPVDIYSVKYMSDKGVTKKVILYLSYMRYRQPKIPIGFYSIQDFQ
jgi:tetratricopeptide (TPR) repeat protein